jgi:sec-independent protein translocase protein TatB
MFGLSFTHLLVLAVLAIIFIGPEQLPEVARTIARLLNEWKRTSSELQNTLTNTLREDPKPNPPLELPLHEPNQFQDAKVQPIETEPQIALVTETDPEKKS